MKLQLLIVSTLFANNLYSNQTHELHAAENPIQVNLTVSNSQDAHAQNQTTAKQTQEVQEKIIYIKEQSSVAKTILLASVSYGTTLALNALYNSEKVAQTAKRIISIFS